MEKILVIYGGKSVEHDISIITALQAMNAIEGEYEILPIYISHEGEFLTGDNLCDVNIYANFDGLVKNRRKVFLDMGKSRVLVKGGFKTKAFEPSAALVCMHGLNGEDGAICGALQMADIPYTCPSLQASAVCMDKAIAKCVLREAGIAVCHDVVGEEVDLKAAAKKLSFPIIVKPSRCGSSVGIKKCDNISELQEAVEIAKNYDKKLVLEHFIENRREFNCACFKRGSEIVSSKVCEVKSEGFYSFDEKYLKSKPNLTLAVEKTIEKKIKKLAAETVAALECDGTVRVDFLMDEEENIFVNEVNTIPGSLAFYLFSGMKEIVIEMIEEAKFRHQQNQKCAFAFDSRALSIFAQVDMNKYAKK